MLHIGNLMMLYTSSPRVLPRKCNIGFPLSLGR